MANERMEAFKTIRFYSFEEGEDSYLSWRKKLDVHEYRIEKSVLTKSANRYWDPSRQISEKLKYYVLTLQCECMEAEAKKKLGDAETKKKLEEAEIKKKLEEAETKKKLEEAEIKKKLEDAEIKKKLEEAETKKKLEEAEIKKKLEEAEAKKKLAEAETKKKLEEAETKKKLVKADSKNKLKEAEAKQKLEDAETKKKSEGGEPKYACDNRMIADNKKVPVELIKNEWSPQPGERTHSDENIPGSVNKPLDIASPLKINSLNESVVYPTKEEWLLVKDPHIAFGEKLTNCSPGTHLGAGLGYRLSHDGSHSLDIIVT
ncbi:hypothetical protein HCN44_008837 [Aphidius gifuensis]|uniref:Uncharacterized protein n=1 Tax=Aphidius gifuensis TaxID=684658 RepID=A0A835CV35_APHGI|nr:hypothetical protein HCN44_008837 [Aphidius gifuensis]